MNCGLPQGSVWASQGCAVSCFLLCICACTCAHEHGYVYTCICVYVYTCICVYVCFAFLWQSAKLKYILKKKKYIYIYIYLLPFSFSGTGLSALLGTNVLGFFHFTKLEIWGCGGIEKVGWGRSTGPKKPPGAVASEPLGDGALVCESGC